MIRNRPLQHWLLSAEPSVLLSLVKVLVRVEQAGP
jgi:hypothetical protein